VLQALAAQRQFLRYTVRDLTDEQARQRTTVSELCLGGIIKHVTQVERLWANFIEHGPPAGDIMSEHTMAAHAASFRMGGDETLAGLLDDYDRAAHRTGEIVAALPGLDASHPLPEAPWFEKGARWSARRTLIHILAETAQHAGHADIIRESLDGATTMG
jgi:hypothetical protein